MKTIPLSPVKRKDRAIEDEAWIRALLHHAAIGIMATAHDDQPYINMRHFVFDQTNDVIYMHGAQAGHTRTAIENNSRVCFSVYEMGRMLPASTAYSMGGEYSSVVVFGRASVVIDDTEATRALQILVEKYFPHLEYGKDYRAIVPEELAHTAVYRIDIEEWSGKRKQAAPDFPGAFWYGEKSKTA